MLICVRVIQVCHVWRKWLIHGMHHLLIYLIGRQGLVEEWNLLLSRNIRLPIIERFVVARIEVNLELAAALLENLRVTATWHLNEYVLAKLTLYLILFTAYLTTYALDDDRCRSSIYIYDPDFALVLLQELLRSFPFEYLLALNLVVLVSIFGDLMMSLLIELRKRYVLRQSRVQLGRLLHLDAMRILANDGTRFHNMFRRIIHLVRGILLLLHVATLLLVFACLLHLVVLSEQQFTRCHSFPIRLLVLYLLYGLLLLIRLILLYWLWLLISWFVLLIWRFFAI